MRQKFLLLIVHVSSFGGIGYFEYRSLAAESLICVLQSTCVLSFSNARDSNAPLLLLLLMMMMLMMTMITVFGDAVD